MIVLLKITAYALMAIGLFAFVFALYSEKLSQIIKAMLITVIAFLLGSLTAAKLDTIQQAKTSEVKTTAVMQDPCSVYNLTKANDPNWIKSAHFPP